MNMLHAFVGFGSFFLVITLICLLGMWFADPLERWAKKHFEQENNEE